MTTYAAQTIGALARRCGKPIEDLAELFDERLAIRMYEGKQTEREAESGALTDLRRIVDNWMGVKL